MILDVNSTASAVLTPSWYTCRLGELFVHGEGRNLTLKHFTSLLIFVATSCLPERRNLMRSRYLIRPK